MITTSWPKRLISILIGASLWSCSAPINRDAVIGVYKANFNKSILVIRQDGTYTLTMAGSDGKTQVNSDKWEFEFREGEPWLTFSKFIFGTPRYDGAAPGFWGVEVTRSFGSIELVVDADLNYYFVKDKR